MKTLKDNLKNRVSNTRNRGLKDKPRICTKDRETILKVKQLHNEKIKVNQQVDTRKHRVTRILLVKN